MGGIILIGLAAIHNRNGAVPISPPSPIELAQRPAASLQQQLDTWAAITYGADTAQEGKLDATYRQHPGRRP
jgi:hypothetical protein